MALLFLAFVCFPQQWVDPWHLPRLVARLLGSLEQQWQNLENSQVFLLSFLGAGKSKLEIKTGRTRQNPDSSAPPSPGGSVPCSPSGLLSQVPTLSCRLRGHSSLQPSICCSLHLGHPPLAHHRISQLIHTPLALILDITSYRELSLKPQDWVGVL